ncbi:MAG: kelch repeat-containing protein, partial [Myxococcales bacterium]
ATLRADGRVLLSGGFGGNATDFTALAASEIFDPATGTFSVAGAFQVPRLSHSAILLSDGRVLAVGGTKADRSGVSETELFDPRTGKWTAGPLLAPAWAGVTATLLGNGKVLLFGGEDAAGFPRPDTFLLE